MKKIIPIFVVSVVGLLLTGCPMQDVLGTLPNAILQVHNKKGQANYQPCSESLFATFSVEHSKSPGYGSFILNPGEEWVSDTVLIPGMVIGVTATCKHDGETIVSNAIVTVPNTKAYGGITVEPPHYENNSEVCIQDNSSGPCIIK